MHALSSITNFLLVCMFGHFCVNESDDDADPDAESHTRNHSASQNPGKLGSCGTVERKSPLSSKAVLAHFGDSLWTYLQAQDR